MPSHGETHACSVTETCTCQWSKLPTPSLETGPSRLFSEHPYTSSLLRAATLSARHKTTLVPAHKSLLRQANCAAWPA